ncbi:hypothetical protein EPO66_03600 [bacterium]|nr:MAG: hypothetical protein EPO66_03600 [bacterium]
MRLYIVWCLTHPKDPKDFREIKCEECSSYENLEFHHEKYAPEEEVYLKDIKISCCKCHRNAPVVKGKQRPQLKTVFENGKRYCITSKYKFGY